MYGTTEMRNSYIDMVHSYFEVDEAMCAFIESDENEHTEWYADLIMVHLVANAKEHRISVA